MKLVVVVFGIVLQGLVPGSATCALGAELQFQHSHRAEGEIVPVTGCIRPASLYLGGSTSGTCHPGDRSSVRPANTALTAASGIEVDVFREWYHAIDGEKILSDALAPVRMPYSSRLPEPDNRIPAQKAQAFWVDVWIPGDARPGEYRLQFRLVSPEGAAEVTVPIRVLAASVPEQDVVAIDHNSYGSSWIGDLYAKERERVGAGFFRSDAFFRLDSRVPSDFHEHRGVFHQLGYGTCVGRRRPRSKARAAPGMSPTGNFSIATTGLCSTERHLPARVAGRGRFHSRIFPLTRSGPPRIFGGASPAMRRNS